MSRITYIGIFFTAVLVLVFNMPVLSLYNRATLWHGVPVSLLFLFIGWVLVILLMFGFSRYKRPQ